jgi:hypothetical protein
MSEHSSFLRHIVRQKTAGGYDPRRIWPLADQFSGLRNPRDVSKPVVVRGLTRQAVPQFKFTNDIQVRHTSCRPSCAFYVLCLPASESEL